MNHKYRWRTVESAQIVTRPISIRGKTACSFCSQFETYFTIIWTFETKLCCRIVDGHACFTTHGGRNVTISAAPYKLFGNMRQFHAFNYENATDLPFCRNLILFHVAISPVYRRFIRIERFIVFRVLWKMRDERTTTNELETYQAIVVDSIDITFIYTFTSVSQSLPNVFFPTRHCHTKLSYLKRKVTMPVQWMITNIVLLGYWSSHLCTGQQKNWWFFFSWIVCYRQSTQVNLYSISAMPSAYPMYFGQSRMFTLPQHAFCLRSFSSYFNFCAFCVNNDRATWNTSDV